MNELIKVEKRTIGDQEINAVDARELHEFLEVGSRFNDWINRQIKRYEFVINSDYSVFSTATDAGGTDRKDYILSINMAKELAMVENNEKGKEARRYFIEIQNKAENILNSIESIDFKGNINDLVFSRNGVGYTTSRIIAEKFEKNHKNVLQIIDNLKTQNLHNLKIEEFNQLNFQPVEYNDAKGELRRAYEVTESGFALVALGFTGQKALEFKIDFINAFFTIKKALMDRIKSQAILNVLPETNYKRGFVYIIGNDDNDYIKIGVSNDVEKRLKQLQTGSWANLIILYKSMICSNSFNIESAVHSKIGTDRIKGEWYDIPLDLAISLIESENHQLKSNFLEAYYASENSILDMKMHTKGCYST